MTVGPTAVRVCRTWTLLYTRGLPVEIRERRRQEIESDLWEQLHDSNEPTRRGVLGRTLRGIHADVWWRYRTLLEQRGARQRSHDMKKTTGSGTWWVPVTVVLGVVIATMGILGLALGDAGEGGSGAKVLASLPPAIGGFLVIGGLAARRQRLVTGSRLVIAGAVLAALDPLFIPVAALVIIGGLWTGNLVTNDRDDRPRVELPGHSMTGGWYRWLVAAALLGAAGFAVLIVWENSGIVPDDCTEANPCWEDSVAWLAWILSWLSAMVTGGIGIVLGVLRYFSRHHTRPA